MSGWTISHITIPGEVDFNPNLSDKDKRVYGYISNLCNRSKGCNYSNKKIALLLNCKEQTISNSINKLKEDGYLLVEILKEHDSDSGYYQIRRIHLNPKMSEIYQPLVIAFNEISNLKNYDGAINILIDTYKKINKSLLKNYNEDIKKLIIKEIREEIENKEKSSSKEEEETCSGEQVVLPTTKINRRNKVESKRGLLSSIKIQNNNTSTEKKSSLQATGVVKEIIDFWLEQNLLLPKQETKSYNNCVKNIKGLLNGRLFGEKYSIEQIKESILNFSFAATDNDFEPSDIVYKKILSKKRIGEFIYSPFSNNDEKSLFQYYLKNKPKPIKSKEVIEDKHPMITKRLKKFYEEEVLGKAKVNYTQKDENCFRISAIKLKDFHKNNLSKFNRYMVVHDMNLSEWLFEAIKADCYGDVSKISPGWFSSNTTFNRRLPAYLFRQNIIEEQDNKVYCLSDSFSKSDDLQINY